jgi:hypothetical protein
MVGAYHMKTLPSPVIFESERVSDEGVRIIRRAEDQGR